MKIIFLDIDGVLNSSMYDRTRTAEDGNIDITRLPLIKQLTDAVGARIVLTSTWRSNWSDKPEELTEKGRELVGTFAKAGLEIYSKTPSIGYNERGQEISEWLKAHSDTDSFVIFDDIPFGWGELADRVIQTNYRIGRGLEQVHIDKAMELLK